MTEGTVQGGNCLYLHLCRRETVVGGVHRCDIKLGIFDLDHKPEG